MLKTFQPLSREWRKPEMYLLALLTTFVCIFMLSPSSGDAKAYGMIGLVMFFIGFSCIMLYWIYYSPRFNRITITDEYYEISWYPKPLTRVRRFYFAEIKEVHPAFLSIGGVNRVGHEFVMRDGKEVSIPIAAWLWTQGIGWAELLLQKLDQHDVLVNPYIRNQLMKLEDPSDKSVRNWPM